MKIYRKLSRMAVRVAIVLMSLISAGLIPLPPLVPAAYADTVRAEIGNPLQAAQELIKQQKYQEALVKIQEADAVANKTPYETFVLEQMRGSAAAGTGDIDTAARAFDAVITSGRLSKDDQLKILLAVSGSYYRAKEYPKAIDWAQRYQEAGGSDPSLGVLTLQSYYLNGDYANAAREAQSQIAVEEKSGSTPSEEQLQILASCYLKQNDSAGYISALEKLVTWYPKKDYWADLLARVQRQPGFSDRLTLDMYRLMLATGNLDVASDYMDMAQLALQAGYPREAQKVLEQGYTVKALGSGVEAPRQKRLKDLADHQTATDQMTLASDAQGAAGRDDNAMVNVGYDLVINGRADQGIALMEQGIAKGELKHPDEERLLLGIAYVQSGNHSKAVQVLKVVEGSDGAAKLAELWTIEAK